MQRKQLQQLLLQQKVIWRNKHWALLFRWVQPLLAEKSSCYSESHFSLASSFMSAVILFAGKSDYKNADKFLFGKYINFNVHSLIAFAMQHHMCCVWFMFLNHNHCGGFWWLLLTLKICLWRFWVLYFFFFFFFSFSYWLALSE